jgi:carboxymethylenebutenolidase
MFHWAEQDTSIPLPEAQAAAARYPDAVSYTYPAQHGFNCDERGAFDADSARLARQRTLDFMNRVLAGG